jgi:hypothetical protein
VTPPHETSRSPPPPCPKRTQVACWRRRRKELPAAPILRGFVHVQLHHNHRVRQRPANASEIALAVPRPRRWASPAPRLCGAGLTSKSRRSCWITNGSSSKSGTPPVRSASGRLQAVCGAAARSVSCYSTTLYHGVCCTRKGSQSDAGPAMVNGAEPVEVRQRYRLGCQIQDTLACRT